MGCRSAAFAAALLCLGAWAPALAAGGADAPAGGEVTPKAVARTLCKVFQDLSDPGSPPEISAREYAALVSEKELAETIFKLSRDGSRVSGYPGNKEAYEYIKARFDSIGLENVTVEPFKVTVPIHEKGTVQVFRGETAEGPPIPIYCLWPNFTRTPTLPRRGIRAHLIHARRGEYGDFNGTTPKGSVVLMDFDSGDNFVNARVLGARAIIFIEPDPVKKPATRSEAEAKFLCSPVNIPRFWLKRSDKLKLDEYRAKAKAKKSPGRKDEEVRVELKARMEWREVETWNIFGRITGTDPDFQDKPVIVHAYYDSMSVVPSLSPGAEQAASVSALIQLARVFSKHRPKRSVIFLATSGHGQILSGMSAFLFAHCYPEKQQKSVAKKAYWQDYFKERIESPMMVGLDLSTRSRRLGVFYTAQLSHQTTRERGQERAFFKPFGNLFTLFARSIVVAEALEPLKEKLSEADVAAAKELLRTKDVFTVEDLEKNFKTAQRVGSKVKKALIPADRIKRVVNALQGARIIREKKFPAPKGKEPEFKLVYEPDVWVQNGVTPIKGVVWQSLLPARMAFDSEVGSKMGLPSITLATINDVRPHVDTPHDLYDQVKVNMDNLLKQTKLLAGLFAYALNEEKPYSEVRAELRNSVRCLRGEMVEFRVGKSILPDFPVAKAVVGLRTAHRGVARERDKYKSFTGVRTARVAVTDEYGRYYLPHVYDRSLVVEPYKYDPESGRITYAADRGQEGAERYKLTIGLDVTAKEWRNVMFRCETLDFYQIDDPRYLRRLDRIDVFGPRNFAPTRYGYSEIAGRGQVVCFEPGQRVKMIMGSGVFGKQYLLINVDDPEAPDDPEKAWGSGYPANKEQRESGVVFLTAEKVVRDMLVLNDSRIKNWLRRYGIANQRLESLQKDAKASFDLAKKAYAAKRYDSYIKYIRQARGYAARAYPEVKGTANDTVKGIVFYFALLLPFSLFCERLLFAFADIRKRVAGFALVFVAVFVTLMFVHPAFKISNAPWMIFVAFVLLAMAVFVIGIVVSRFNAQVAEMRRAAAEVHHADVGRISASFAAFNLGISNMRKRKVRTILTTGTLILLTFTVLSFTSVSTFTRFNKIRVEADATYAGVLIRDRNWQEMDDIADRYVASAFGDVGEQGDGAKLKLARRAWVVALRKQDQLHLRVSNLEESLSSYANGAIGLTPLETDATRLNRALLPGGRWFKTEDEKSCLLPAEMAKRLNVGVGDEVLVFGKRLSVIGLLDKDVLNDITDLDGARLSPIDTTDLESRTGFGQSETVATVREHSTEIATFQHLKMDNLLIVPYKAALAVGGRLQSIAVVKPEEMEQEEFVDLVKRFMSRVGMTLFLSDRESNTVTAYSSIALSSFKGLQGLFVPIMIAALIVLNTMMGAVYERFREIGIYSSVGLAPLHIAALFMAESCVYAVLGAIIGYLIGQVMGTTLAHFDLLGGMTLNYSSMSTVFSTLIVMAVVLLSTVYPAKVASSMAVPDVTRRWQFPEPNGDEWVFDFPFTVASAGVLGLYVFLNGYFEGYTEESLGSFYTNNVGFGAAQGEYGMGYRLSMMVWLAPFDMGVSQNVEMRAIQTEDKGIARIQVYIRRVTGEVSAWRRLNMGFLTAIRKQFLIWRTIPEGVKEDYATQGQEILAHIDGNAGGAES